MRGLQRGGEARCGGAEGGALKLGEIIATHEFDAAGVLRCPIDPAPEPLHRALESPRPAYRCPCGIVVESAERRGDVGDVYAREALDVYAADTRREMARA